MLRRKGGTALTAVVTAFALASCGGGSSSGGSSGGGASGGASSADRSSVSTTIHSYFAALGARDPVAVCRLVTPAVQSELIRAASRLGGPPPADCKNAVAKEELGLTPAVLGPLQHVNVHIGVLQGTSATAHELGGPAIRRRGLNIVRLQKMGSSWVISELGVGPRR